MDKKELKSITVNQEVKQFFKDLAKEEDRTVSYLVNGALKMMMKLNYTNLISEIKKLKNKLDDEVQKELKESLSIRFNQEVKQFYEKKAQEENVATSDLVNNVLKIYIEYYNKI